MYWHLSVCIEMYRIHTHLKKNDDEDVHRRRKAYYSDVLHDASLIEATTMYTLRNTDQKVPP